MCMTYLQGFLDLVSFRPFIVKIQGINVYRPEDETKTSQNCFYMSGSIANLFPSVHAVTFMTELTLLHVWEVMGSSCMRQTCLEVQFLLWSPLILDLLDFSHHILYVLFPHL